MSEPARLEARIRHLDELGEVVGAMRTLAASHVQQARGGLGAIEAYTRTVEAALARVVPMLSDGGDVAAGGATAWLLVGGEHGFCGDFASRLLSRLRERLRPGDCVLVLGSRSRALAGEAGIEVDWADAMASHAAGVPAVVADLVDALYERVVAGRVERAVVIHGDTAGSGGSEVREQPLLPLDLAAWRAPSAAPDPVLNLPAAELVERLVDEYVLSRLVHAATTSLAAENAARLLATSAAADAVAERVETLRGESRRLRQAAITAELAELIGSGAFEAV